MQRHFWNAHVKHQLDRFTQFGNHLYTLDMIIFENSFKDALNPGALSNDVLVKLVYVALESCCVIQKRLKNESKQSCVHELIYAIEKTLRFIVWCILDLIKRNDYIVFPELDRPSLKNHGVARILVDELLHRCPEISSMHYGYTWPVMHVIFKPKCRVMRFSDLTIECTEYHYHFVKMVIQSKYDLNAADWEGNQILHVVTSEVLKEIDFMLIKYPEDHDAIKRVVENRLKITNLLLENGSYPHARNKKGHCPCDGLPDVKLHQFNPENLIMQFKNLIGKYERKMTLKYISAKKIADSQIPYQDVLPGYLVKFVCLH